MTLSSIIESSTTIGMVLGFDLDGELKHDKTHMYKLPAANVDSDTLFCDYGRMSQGCDFIILFKLNSQ